MSQRIAFLGLGIMGSRMAANLCRAGFDVCAWNRTRARAEELAATQGAEVADRPADAAAGADIVVSMMVDSPQVEEVLFGPGGAAESLGEGDLVADMSTIAPSSSRDLAARLRKERGAGFLDAPVTGSRPKAEDATLTIMVGGLAADFERARPAFEAMGRLVLHVGAQGHGSMVKLINNTAAAINTAALAEAIDLGERAGLDLDALARVMAAGSGASAMLDLKAAPMRKRDFEPLFKLDHMLKDVRHCMAEAEALGAPLATAGGARSLYERAARDGHGEEDFAAVLLAVAAGVPGAPLDISP